MTERVPPHSVEAEESVLGAMLLDEEARVKASRVLAADDFYLDRHKNIFKAILAVPVADITTVLNVLDKESSNSGGIEYLAKIVGAVSTTQTITAHAGIVKEKSQYRKFLKAAQEVVEAALTEKMEVLDLKGFAFEQFDIKTEAAAGTHITKAVETYKEAIVKRKTVPGADIKTGLPWVDKHTGGLAKGAFVLLAARPSVGKTTLAIQIAKHNAYKGKRILIFSIEMTEEQIVEKMVSSIAGVDSTYLQNPGMLKEQETKAIEEATKELAVMDFMIYEDVVNIEEIKAICKQEKAEHGVDLIVIDYLQIIETRRKTSGEYEKLTHISQELKKIAKQLKCACLVLSQLKRPEGGNREPVLSDLRGSGSLEQDADIVLFLHDPAYGNYEAEQNPNDMDLRFIIGKQREGQRDISTILRYQKPIQRIVERQWQPSPPPPQKTKPKGRNTKPKAEKYEEQEDMPW